MGRSQVGFQEGERPHWKVVTSCPLVSGHIMPTGQGGVGRRWGLGSPAGCGEHRPVGTGIAASGRQLTRPGQKVLTLPGAPSGV